MPTTIHLRRNNKNRGKLKINNPEYVSSFLGELIGTLILVFFGCGSVAVTILFSSHSGLFQIAAIWGIGVALAIKPIMTNKNNLKTGKCP
jgi:hypothetical protein